MSRLTTLLAIEPADKPTLLRLAPTFVLTSACTIILASVAKALFLSAHEVNELPWVLFGSAAFTAFASSAYVVAIERVSLGRRFTGLLLVAAAVFIALRTGYRLHPETMSVVISITCPALGVLIATQAWNMTSSLLPSRQGKRLFPVLGAAATLGAAIGGFLVRLTLAWIPAEDLMWFAVVLLIVPVAQIRSVVRALSQGGPDLGASGDPNEEMRPAAEGAHGLARFGKGFRALAETPLLLRLSIFVFLMQAASVVVDYQFSGELKSHLPKQELAAFMGGYYSVSNVVVLGLMLFATGRIVRNVGIEIAISATAVLLGLTSAIYFGAAFTGSFETFWILVAAAFFERISQFALARPATQMLVAPIAARKAERAKTLIDGVVYRFATMATSAFLLVLSLDPTRLWVLAPIVIVACIGVVALGLSIGPHYRQALFEALRARRLDTSVEPGLREGLGRSALGDIERRLHAPSSEAVLTALDVVREIKVGVRPELLESLVRRPEGEVTLRALATIQATGMQPSRALLESLLDPDRPPEVLREVLKLLSPHQEESLVDRIRPFTTHSDPGVASIAYLWTSRMEADGDTVRVRREIGDEIRTGSRRQSRSSIDGATRAINFARELPKMLDDPNLERRIEAIHAMGQLGLDVFVEPLLGCLARGELRSKTVDTLVRIGAPVVETVEREIAEPTHPVTTRIWMLHAIERIASARAVDLLVAALDSPETAMRSQAAACLWRMGRDFNAPRPEVGRIRARILREIHLLETYAALDALEDVKGVYQEFFRGEIQALRVQAEARTFRLLGLVYPRAAMHRAYTHYRSPVRRTRSNAVELLDQQLIDSSFKPFVALIERGAEDEADPGARKARQATFRVVSTDEAVAHILKGGEPWLERVWTWASRKTRGEVETAMATDPLDRVFVLKGIPLFAGLSGEQLMPVADIVTEVPYEAGDIVFREGDPGNHVYIIKDGTVEVLRAGVALAVLGAKECFGEMALLDEGARSATCRCVKDTTLLAISREDFQDLLDLHSPLARGIIGVLTRRLRAANEGREG